jgi:hypothetical protein
MGYERAYGNRARTVRKAIADLFLLIYGLRCGSYGNKILFSGLENIKDMEITRDGLLIGCVQTVYVREL